MNAPRQIDAYGEIDRRVAIRTWLIATAFLGVVGGINVLSLLTEAEREGNALDWRVPVVLEATSIAVLIAVTWAAILLERRMPLTADNWRKALAVYAGASIAFSGLHIAGMYALRKLAFAALGQSYSMLDVPLRDVVYEYRKDLLPFAIAMLVATLLRRLEEQRIEAAGVRDEARETGRLTLKSGGRTIFIEAAKLEWAQAAGNYVEVRASGRTHLARITLAALKDQLAEAGVDIAQAHRSLLVRRDSVREIVPTRDGDFRILMGDGIELRGSRRYRDELR